MIFMFFVFCIICIYSVYFSATRGKERIKTEQENNLKTQILELSETASEITPSAFFQLRNNAFVRSKKDPQSNIYNFPGVYVLHSKTKDMYYIGQGRRVFDRVNDHFSGRGNGDVYADHKYGDLFTIRMLALRGSGFSTLNDLEKSAILTYNSYAKGYNKTRGG